MKDYKVLLMGFFLGISFVKTVNLIFEFSINNLIGNLYLNMSILILILMVKKENDNRKGNTG